MWTFLLSVFRAQNPTVVISCTDALTAQGFSLVVSSSLLPLSSYKRLSNLLEVHWGFLCIFILISCDEIKYEKIVNERTKG